MCPGALVLFAQRHQLLHGVVPQRLRDEESNAEATVLPAADERELEEVLQPVERLRRIAARFGDRLDGGEWDRPGEHAQPREQRLRGGIEQCVRPLDRRPQAPLALGRVGGSPGEQAERSVEPAHEHLGAERTDPGGSELDRERHLVEAAADLLDRGSLVAVGLEVGHQLPGPLDEQRNAVAGRERPE
jgi:hypothetical protein